ncbi:MAG: hypothetical protein HY080_03375 [Gammaproteobacteria bacterium]|nr:hypothetical protein [Gammaproteobacteria bacterium]
MIKGREDVALLAGSTDGTDGPTTVAGAVVARHDSAVESRDLMRHGRCGRPMRDLITGHG